MSKEWDTTYKARWDERYGEDGYAYGKEPNQFFKKWLLKFKAGSILLPADGEGRNGVFAAKNGWQVTSLDLSEEGREKTLQLAKENDVNLEYIVGDLAELDFEKASYDAVGLIYAHFSASKKAKLHQQLTNYIKKDGIVIFEAFSKRHLAYKQNDSKVGGPNDLAMLFSEEEIITDFKNFEPLLLEEKEIYLSEGKYHNGKGSVIRFVGRKK
ncbi:class I SAM-dependent methyltransferase [Chondrinema litorale]|uniref:class I SAM-dependent methyltransferase n=1 Tax=Chondrinema litorale TaxID=2994555 RepID=UPI0025427936|nr:class I SAM-dependent methyltransferase [Chondrinema litorale]UZR96897.1 class I SAM-dependent methyltransferase [Chondrinema litorale]